MHVLSRRQLHGWSRAAEWGGGEVARSVRRCMSRIRLTILILAWGTVLGKISSQLSPPKINRNNPFRPNKLRKYHDREETQRTSRSGVSMPLCSMDLKPRVRGKGSLTARRIGIQLQAINDRDGTETH